MEIWKAVNKDYNVSNTGKVYSVRRHIILKQVFNEFGYLVVGINHNLKKVSRLVAEAFIPNPQNLPQVNHIDGNKSNNNVSNLEWCTAKENTNHAIETGLRDTAGKNNANVKLTEVEVREIRTLKDTHTLKEIAEKYNVQFCTIWKIIHNKTWKSVV